MSASKTSPIADCLGECARQVDAASLPDLVPKVLKMSKQGLGASTKAGCARFIAGESTRHVRHTAGGCVCVCVGGALSQGGGAHMHRERRAHTPHTHTHRTNTVSLSLSLSVPIFRSGTNMPARLAAVCPKNYALAAIGCSGVAFGTRAEGLCQHGW